MRLSLSLASSGIEVRKTLLLGTLRLEQLGLLVFAFLKRKYIYIFLSGSRLRASGVYIQRILGIETSGKIGRISAASDAVRALGY